MTFCGCWKLAAIALAFPGQTAACSDAMFAAHHPTTGTRAVACRSAGSPRRTSLRNWACRQKPYVGTTGELVDKGLVRDRSRGDYWRGVEYRDGRRIVYGVDLSPLASCYTALVEAAERKRRQEANLGRLRERLSRGKTTLRRERSRAWNASAHPTRSLPPPAWRWKDLPLRPSRLKDTTELATQLRDCEQALEALQRAADQACETAPSPGEAPEPAGNPEEPRNPRDNGARAPQNARRGSRF